MHGDLSGLVGLNIEELIKVGYKVDVLLKSIMERMAKIHSQAPPPAPSVSTDSIDMASPSQYLTSPQQEEGWLDMVSSGGDVGTQVYGGNASHDGSGFSGGDMMMETQFSDLGFSSSPFPPM